MPERHPDAANLTIEDGGYTDERQYTGNCAVCGEEVQSSAYYDRYEDDESNARQYFHRTDISLPSSPQSLHECEVLRIRHGVLCGQCIPDHQVTCGGPCGAYAMRDSVLPIVDRVNDQGMVRWCQGCVQRQAVRGRIVSCAGQCGVVIYRESQQVAHCVDCALIAGINTSNHEQVTCSERTVSKIAIGKEDQRPFSRVCSFEMEMDGDYYPMLRELADAGYCAGEVYGYHTSGRSRYPIHFENDASVDVELIFPYVDMNPRSPSLHIVRDVVQRVTKEVERGNVKFSMRTGCHVHVDAHNFHPMHVRNLYLQWCYLEDIIFRLSAVGYRCHRLAAGRNSHAQIVQKDRLHEVIEQPMMFGSMYKGLTSHSSGVNFGNYGHAENCRCGAIEMGMHHKCKCTLGKNTIEFRVPNGTGNLDKVYTYLFLFNNLMNVAQFHPDAIKKLGKLEEFTYTRDTPNKLNRNKYKQRIEWMLDHLCYNEREKDALIWAIKHSDLNGVLTSSYLEGLEDRECVLPAVEDDTPYIEMKQHRFPRLERA